MIEVGNKRAEAQKRPAQARGKQAKKNEEARCVLVASGEVVVRVDGRVPLRSAEGRKVADYSQRSADCSKQEPAINKDWHLRCNDRLQTSSGCAGGRGKQIEGA